MRLLYLFEWGAETMDEEKKEVQTSREEAVNDLPSSSGEARSGGVHSDSDKPSFSFWRYFFKILLRIILVLAILALLGVIALFFICLNFKRGFGP